MALYMKGYTVKYRSELSVLECMHNLMRQPWEFGDKFGIYVSWYECTKVSESQLLLVYTGGKFQKMRRTQFIVDFTPEQDTTLITMQFTKDLFGLPPMTHPNNIDPLMEERCKAVRVEFTYY